MRILLTGGGSGGHITPLIAVVQAVRRQIEKQGLMQPEFVFIGPKINNKLWQGLLAKEGIKIISITAGKLRRYQSSANITDLLLRVPLGFIQSLWQVFWHMPDVVFSKGGYGSVPVVLASRVFFLPIVMHESDAVIGLANKIGLKYSLLILYGFSSLGEELPKEKSKFVGNPIREEITIGDREVARQFFHIRTANPVLLVLGGSQGAEFINDTILNNLPDFLKTFEIIHVTGQKKFETLGQELEGLYGRIDFSGYHPYPFLTEELKEAFAVCDIILSRPGANTIAEISAVGKPSVLIPIAGSAQDHQKINAYEYGRTGAAIVFEEDNLLPHLLLRDLQEITNNKALRYQMIEAAKRFNPTNAAEKIAQEILGLITKNVR